MFFALILGFIVSDVPSPELKWHRFETANFEILTINKKDGEYLSKSIEPMRKWTLERWGIKSVDFSTKCKVLVVSDKDLYLKLFKKQKPLFKIEREKGKIKNTIIWCWSDDGWHTSILPNLLTEICLQEFEQKHNAKFPLWTKRGMSVLNRNTSDIRKEFGEFNKVFANKSSIFTLPMILGMKEDKIRLYEPQHQELFDKQSAFLCLYLQKEKGNKKFLEFMESCMENKMSIQKIDFEKQEDFDKIYEKYMYNLSKEIEEGKTPNVYLTWD